MGARTEQLMIGLLTRSEGIGTLTIRALAHHDQTQIEGFKGSYDLLVVDAAYGSIDEPTPHQAQAKTGCQDFCHDKQGVAKGQRTLEGYTENIILISGEDDICPIEQAGHMARWLGDEINGRASPEAINILDNTSLRLLEILVDPQPWRMGKVPIDPAWHG